MAPETDKKKEGMWKKERLGLWTAFGQRAQLGHSEGHWDVRGKCQEHRGLAVDEKGKFLHIS